MMISGSETCCKTDKLSNLLRQWSCRNREDTGPVTETSNAETGFQLYRCGFMTWSFSQRTLSAQTSNFPHLSIAQTCRFTSVTRLFLKKMVATSVGSPTRQHQDWHTYWKKPDYISGHQTIDPQPFGMQMRNETTISDSVKL